MGKRYAAGLEHRRAGHTYEARIRATFAQRAYQGGAEAVAGSFAGNNCDERTSHLRHLTSGDAASAYDAAHRGADEIDQARDFGKGITFEFQQLERIFQGVALTIQRAIGAFQRRY